MSAVTNGRVLRIALAGSIAVHLIIAAVVYARPVTAAQEQRPQHSDIIKIKLPAPTPTPPPRKRTLPRPQRQARAVQPAIHQPKLIAQQVNPHGTSAPPVEPTGIPQPVETSGPDIAPTGAPVDVTPAPTPKPACSAPDVPAKTIVTQTPEVPDDSSGSFTGTAKVKVDLDASGAVVGTSIYETTGNPMFDRAALQAAQESRYAPEQRDCKNISGSYLFTIDFQ